MSVFHNIFHLLTCSMHCITGMYGKGGGELVTRFSYSECLSMIYFHICHFNHSPIMYSSTHCFSCWLWQSGEILLPIWLCVFYCFFVVLSCLTRVQHSHLAISQLCRSHFYAFVQHLFSGNFVVYVVPGLPCPASTFSIACKEQWQIIAYTHRLHKILLIVKLHHNCVWHTQINCEQP
jgi:hypothetical protein